MSCSGDQKSDSTTISDSALGTNEGGRLSRVAELRGLTNHKFGDRYLQGGIANCDGRPTILAANPDWTRVIAVTLDGGALAARDHGPLSGPESLDPLRACR